MSSSTSKINVAVAGVTSGFGYAIAAALVTNPAVTVTLLTRQSTSSAVPEVLQPFVQQGAEVRTIDYASIESITDALRGVHTVISTLNTPLNPTSVDNLLEGAKAAGVKRFAPSEFSTAKETNTSVEFYRAKAVHWEKVKASGLEYTAFRNGMMMDYFANGSKVKYDIPLQTYTFAVDFANRRAEIPGTGNELLTVTTLTDVGKFVSAAVTLGSWPEELGMSGETLSLNEVVRAAEEVIGEKFAVSYVSKDELKARQAMGIEQHNWYLQFSSELYLAMIAGEAEIRDPYLNKATSVQPTKVKEFLQKSSLNSGKTCEPSQSVGMRRNLHEATRYSHRIKTTPHMS